MPTLIVTVVNASNLTPKDLSGTSDPYVIVRMGGTRHRTQTRRGTNNPFWGEQFTLMVMDPMKDSVTFDVYDKDLITKDDSLGSAIVQLNTLRRGVPERMNLNLMGARQGTLTVELLAQDFGLVGQPMMTQPMMTQPVMTQPMMSQGMMVQPPMMQTYGVTGYTPTMTTSYPSYGVPMQPMQPMPMQQSTTYTTTTYQTGVPPPQGYPPYGQPGYPPYGGGGFY
nr:unnamed protein product [Naegleria fowleri]